MLNRSLLKFLNRKAVMSKGIIKILFCTLLICISNVASSEPLPRVMLIVNEKNLGTYSVSEAERTITQALLDKGVEVVDADMVRSSVNRDKLVHAATGGPAAAAAMGLKFGAEVVVIGEVLAKGSAQKLKNSDMRSYNATVSLKAIRTDTSSILTTSMKSLARMHVDDVAGGTIAIRDATELVLKEFIPKLFGSYGSVSDSGKPIRLLVSNINQIWQLAAIKDLLRSQKGVSDVVQRSYVTGVAEFDVHWGGSTGVLAEELTLAEPQAFRLKVLGISQHKLDVQLVSVGG